MSEQDKQLDSSTQARDGVGSDPMVALIRSAIESALKDLPANSADPNILRDRRQLENVCHTIMVNVQQGLPINHLVTQAIQLINQARGDDAEDDDVSIHKLVLIFEQIAAKAERQEAAQKAATSVANAVSRASRGEDNEYEIVVTARRMTPEQKRDYDRTHPGLRLEEADGLQVERPDTERDTVATSGNHRPADAKRVATTRARRRQATATGGYVDVQRTSQAEARAKAGGVDDDDTWVDGRSIQTDASIERIWDGKGDGDNVAAAFGEAVSRRTGSNINRVWIGGSWVSEGYLGRFNREAPKDMVKALDHNGDGKVSMEEFERAMFNADLSYSKMSALDGKKGAYDSRTVTYDEFMKAARYLTQASGVIQDRGLMTIDAKGNKRFDENGDGKITMDEFRRGVEKAGSSFASQVGADGKLQIGEMASGMLWIEVRAQMQGKSISAAYDKNKDGKVSVDEIVGVLRAKGIRFDQVDTAAEFQQVLGANAPGKAAAPAAKPGNEELLRQQLWKFQGKIGPIGEAANLDHKGAVTIDELGKFLNSKGVKPSQIDTLAELQAVIAQYAPKAKPASQRAQH